jgi:hypothetical protein
VPAAIVFFGRCCCPCEIVAAHAPLSQIAAREDNRLYFDQGGGKDLTDSLIMQYKQRIREGVKPTGGSERNASECVATVQRGEDQGGCKNLTDYRIMQHKQRIREVWKRFEVGCSVSPGSNFSTLPNPSPGSTEF